MTSFLFLESRWFHEDSFAGRLEPSKHRKEGFFGSTDPSVISGRGDLFNKNDQKLLPVFWLQWYSFQVKIECEYKISEVDWIGSWERET